MSTSLLYHTRGIRGYDYIHARYEKGCTIFRVEQKESSLRSSCCGSRNVKKRGATERTFKTTPVGNRPVLIELPVQRVECLKCGAVRRVNVQFAKQRRSYTKGFERYALDLSRHMTIQDVAHHLNVSWDTIKEIQKRYLHRRFNKPKLGKLKRMAIDEIYPGGRSGYLTVVMDLSSGAVIEVAEGKNAAALDPFWKRLKHSRAQVEAVATDMGPAYIKAVRENLPEATLVFDHFHVIKLYNEKLTKLRRAVATEADALGKKVLKGTRWLLMKTPGNLLVEKDEHTRLQEALRLNQPLATAYYMKDDLRRVWQQDDKEAAAFLLDDWIKRAAVSGIQMLIQFGKTLAAYRSGILAYYDFDGLSTGPLEGTNNKIKTLQKMAYGFRDKEFLKLKIKGLHETKYALVG
jgi:transposase